MNNYTLATLVIAEHDNHALKDATLNTLAAAAKLSQAGDVLVAGYDCKSVVMQLKHAPGVRRIIYVDDPLLQHPLAESLTKVIVELAAEYSHILAPATTFGKNFMPCVAAKLNVMQISDVISIENNDTFKRPIYAGNAIATIQSLDAQKVLTVRSTAFPAIKLNPQPFADVEIKYLEFEFSDLRSRFVSQVTSQSERPELSSAKIIVAGGRGLQNKENFALLEQLAVKLNAAIGASRAAVDAGFVPNDYQIGQTGKVVAPQLYIAIGISGAIQHLAGMKDSKVIVAINKDPDAPIFQVADYGLVGDLFELVPQLIEAI